MSNNSNEFDTIIDRASKLVTPSGREEGKLERVSSLVLSLLQAEFDGERRNSDVVIPEVSLGGSYAKGTWLKESVDVDYFLLYPTTYQREKLESEAIRVSKQAVRDYPTNMRFAEHPYVEAVVQGVRVNLVPCYKVKQGEWQSAADRSPFHTDYVKSRFNDRLRLETRLLKKFIKCSKTYGAEVKIQGFSGYVCEVLTLKFGSFLNVLGMISKSKLGQVISLEEDSYNKDLVASFKSALVILDPVDQTRNLGGAISIENVARLTLHSRKFLERPSLSFFKEPHTPGQNSNAVARENQDTLLSRTTIVTFRIEKRSVDILWGQLRKSSTALASKLEQIGFEVIRFSSASNENDECAFLFLLRENRIANVQLKLGPEYFRSDEVKRYLEKNKRKSMINWFDANGRIISLTRRKDEESDARTVLKEFLSDQAQVEKIGLSKAIQSEIKNGFTMSTGTKLISGAKESPKRPWLVDAIKTLISSEVDLV